MKRKIFIDGGSHLGESVAKFRRIYDKNNEFEYYMFEPNLELFNHFNAKEEFKDCKKFNLGLSSRNENNVKLWGGDNSRNGLETCGATINESKKKFDKYSDNEYIFINIISLSDFLKKEFSGQEEIDLKLDIEGAEYEVFEDLIATNEIKKVSKIFCEFHTQWLDNSYKTREEEILKKLNEMGFQVEYWDAL